jgi:hypothetical protein
VTRMSNEMVMHMSFALESQMLPAMDGQLEMLASSRQFIAASEVMCNSWIIDLMLGPIQMVWIEWLGNNMAMTQSLLALSEIELEALAMFVCKSNVSACNLSKAMYCTEEEAIKEYLVPFAEFGLIAEVDTRCYRATKWVYAVPQRLVAVELKLCRWREVLEQALRNKECSDMSYAVLDCSTIDKRPQLEGIFRQANIGLIGLADDGLMTTVVKPERNREAPSRECCYRGLRLLRSLLRGDCNTSLVWEGGSMS